MARLWGSSGGNKIYLQVSNGKLAQRVDDSYTGPYTQRVLTKWPNIGKAVKEVLHPSAQGFITNVEIRTWEYGNQVMVTLDNELVIQFASNDFSSIANTLLNFWKESDLSKEVTISAYLGKNWYGAFSVWQWQAMAKWYVTKEDSKGCPQATQKQIGWKVKWDFDYVEDWFFKELANWISTNFPDGAKETPVWAISNISKQAMLSDMWEHNPQEEQEDMRSIHTNTNTPLPGYAPMPTGMQQPIQTPHTQQVQQVQQVTQAPVSQMPSASHYSAQQQTWNATARQAEGISIEDLPF